MTEEKKMTARQAKSLLKKQRADRIAAVEEGIQKLLDKHNCSMDFQMTFSATRGMMGGSLIIAPRADESPQ